MAHDNEGQREDSGIAARAPHAGAGWFIVGGIAVLVLVGAWLIWEGVFDLQTTAGIPIPGDAEP